MVRHPLTVRGDQPLRDVVDRVMSESRYAAYPVTDNGRALGLLSSAGIAALPPGSIDSLRVRDRMIPADRALTLTDEDDLVDGFAALLQTDLRRALVVHESEFAGLLSITDVWHLLEVRENRAARR